MPYGSSDPVSEMEVIIRTGKFEPKRQCLQYLCMGLQAVGIMVSEEKIFKCLPINSS